MASQIKFMSAFFWAVALSSFFIGCYLAFTDRAMFGVPIVITSVIVIFIFILFVEKDSEVDSLYDYGKLIRKCKAIIIQNGDRDAGYFYIYEKGVTFSSETVKPVSYFYDELTYEEVSVFRIDINAAGFENGVKSGSYGVIFESKLGIKVFTDARNKFLRG